MNANGRHRRGRLRGHHHENDIVLVDFWADWCGQFKVFNKAGARPAPALKHVIDAVKGLNMEEVHAEVAMLQAEHEHQHQH